MTEIQLRRAEIESVELSEEEVREALWTAKVVKWQRERNREYWKKLETEKSCTANPAEGHSHLGKIQTP